MITWSEEIDDLRNRLGDLIGRTELGDDARELASEAFEELSVVIEEMQSQNAELIASREALDEERVRYRDLFESVPDGYLITDTDGMILEANETACAMFGRPRDKVVGKPLATFIESPDQRAFYGQLDRIRRTEFGGSLTINLAVRDHVSIPANLRATVARQGPGDRPDIRWLIHDRTAELGSEELRVSEERLRALFDAADVGVVLGDVDGHVVFINQYAASVLRYGPSDLSTGSWLDATHPDDRADVDRCIDAAVGTGEAGLLRHRVVHDGDVVSWVDHDVVPFRNDAGTVTGFVSTIADVTTEHDAQADLQASKDFTDALLDTVGALVTVLDPQGRVLRFNRTCEDVTGLRGADVIGRRLVDTLVPIDQREEVSSALRALAAPGTNTVENDWVTAAGERRRISWTNTNLADPDGRVTAIIGTGIDVTDQRLLESRLAQADRLESVGRLTAGIAHDFNNTLATLRLRIDRLSGRELDAASRTDIAAADQTIDRTQNLIADLLSFSSTQDLRPVPTDVNAEIERMADLLASLLGSSTVIDLDLTDGDATAYIDPGRFDQILTNMAINAHDAMPDGGTLTIATTLDTITSEQPVSTPTIPRLQPGTYVRMTVIDTGSGITAHELPHIFDPYFTTKPPGRGTGLGLATTYGTINQSGGAVLASSEPGVGTTLTIWLPHRVADTGATASRGVSARAVVGRVLIVEDDADVRHAVAAELQQLGYDTDEAGNGTHALGFLDAPIDVLLADVELPDMTGPDVAQQFRAQRSDLAVLFMSGNPVAKRNAAVVANAVFLQKPFTADELDTALGTARRRT